MDIPEEKLGRSLFKKWDYKSQSTRKTNHYLIDIFNQCFGEKLPGDISQLIVEYMARVTWDSYITADKSSFNQTNKLKSKYAYGGYFIIDKILDPITKPEGTCHTVLFQNVKTLLSYPTRKFCFTRNFPVNRTWQTDLKMQKFLYQFETPKKFPNEHKNILITYYIKLLDENRAQKAKIEYTATITTMDTEKKWNSSFLIQRQCYKGRNLYHNVTSFLGNFQEFASIIFQRPSNNEIRTRLGKKFDCGLTVKTDEELSCVMGISFGGVYKLITNKLESNGTTKYAQVHPNAAPINEDTKNRKIHGLASNH